MKFAVRLLIAGVGVALLAVVGYACWQLLALQVEPPVVTPGEQQVELAADKQQSIWDAEHVAFVLERRFGAALLKDFAASDEPALRGRFRESFQGELPALGSTQTTRLKPPIGEIRQSGDKFRSATLAEVLTAIGRPWSDLDSVTSQQLRVLSVQREAADDNAWRTRLLLTVRGLAAGRPSEYSSVHEVDFELAETTKAETGAVVQRWRMVEHTQRVGERPLFEEVTSAYGLDQLPLLDNWKLPTAKVKQNRFQLAVEDFDRDGYLDIAVAGLHCPPLLLRSHEGKRFENVAGPLGIEIPNYEANGEHFLAAWIDFDNDDYPDLLFGRKLYQNIRGRRFVDVTDQSGLYFDPECMGCAVADYDADGRLDLYFVYQQYLEDEGDEQGQEAAPRKWIDENDSGKPNQLWRNLGKGRFVDVTGQVGAGGGNRHTHAANWFFYDDDHLPDLYLANDFGVNVLLRNTGEGRFLNASEPSQATGFATSMAVTSGDLNNDGRVELYVANMYSKMGRRIIGQLGAADYPDGIFSQIKGSCAGNRLYWSRDDGVSFEESGETLGVGDIGWAYAPAMFDADADGWLDLYATTGFLSFQRGKPDG